MRAGSRRSQTPRARSCPTQRHRVCRPGTARSPRPSRCARRAQTALAARTRQGLNHPVMDLVGDHVMPPPPTPRPPQHFLRLEPHPRRQQPKPGSTPARRLDRVVDLVGEHLISPTDPQDRPPLRRPPHQGIGQPEPTQPLQIGHRGPAPWQHHEVRMLDVGGLGGGEHIDPRLRRDGVQIGGVGDPRQPDRRDPQRPGSPRQPRPLRESERILRVEPHLVQPRDNSEAPQPGSPGQLVEPGVKHRLVAAELVEEIPRQQRPIRVVDDPPVAEDRRQHATAIDVADEQRSPNRCARPKLT